MKPANSVVVGWFLVWGGRRWLLLVCSLLRVFNKFAVVDRSNDHKKSVPSVPSVMAVNVSKLALLRRNIDRSWRIVVSHFLAQKFVAETTQTRAISTTFSAPLCVALALIYSLTNDVV